MQQFELYAKYPQPLISLLRLKEPDKWDQDWEWCVSDENRIAEFIDFYKAMPLNDKDKMSLMMIIIDSFNHKTWDNGFDSGTWETISNLIKDDLLFFKEQVIYWSSVDYGAGQMDDAWAIAWNMRMLLRMLHESDSLTEDDIEGWCDDVRKEILS